MILTKVLNSKSAEDPVNENNFFIYLQGQKQLIRIACIIFVVIFIILKFCFPVPDFFLDSYNYVSDAVSEVDISYRAIGYPDFLRLTHCISGNANFTVFIQYILFFTSTLFCFFSCDYLYGVPKKLKLVAFYLALFNPLLILQTNLISSDSLFCSLTVTWFTFCLWIAKKNKPIALVMQVIFLLLCFHVRYTAVFYPIIACVVFLLSKGRFWYKIIGIVLSVSIIYFYVERQKSLSESEFNVRVFSGFSGWQIANNVLCYYKKIDVDNKSLPTLDTRNIDRLVKKFIDSIYEDNYVDTKYMWNHNSPLKLYVRVRKTDRHESFFTEWICASKPLGEYGWEIVKQDPIAYVRYFMGTNFKNYLFPNPEILSNYNALNSAIPAETKQWFDFDFDNLYCRFSDLQKWIIFLYPTIFFILNATNIIIIFSLLFSYLKLRGKVDIDTRNLFFFWCVFYFGYMVFCLFSTIVLLRYLDPLFTIGMIMPFVLLQQINNLSARSSDSLSKPTSKQV